MNTIAHIINPVIVDETSDLLIAQPITFETMRIARKNVRGTAAVQLWTAQYPEDRSLVPNGWLMTPDLDRSVLDVGTFKHLRKLPLMRDILDRLYEATDAEYLIYTNVDIALMPHFYTVVDRFIEAGIDAFVINRRTISDRFTDTSEIMLMYAEAGQAHFGHDCFVFRRDVYPQYILGDVCIGVNWVGKILLQNLQHHAMRFKEFRSKHLTFHIGNQRVWENRENIDYIQHNTREAQRALMQLKGRNDNGTSAHRSSDTGHDPMGAIQLPAPPVAR
jgi:hypothetical protein